MLELPFLAQFQEFGVGNSIRHGWEAMGPGFELLRRQSFGFLRRRRFLGGALFDGCGGERGLRVRERGGDYSESYGELEEIELGFFVVIIVVVVVVWG